MHPNTAIYPLKIRGERASGKSKKRKINLSKSIGKDTDSCWPSIAGTFDKNWVEMRSIKEFVERLPQGPRGPSTTCYSYWPSLTMRYTLRIRIKRGIPFLRLRGPTHL